LLQHSKLNTTEALAAIREKIAGGEFGDKVAYLAEFIAKSERGIIK
jgi:UDP-N-acetylglucosamine acyltransferase